MPTMQKDKCVLGIRALTASSELRLSPPNTYYNTIMKSASDLQLRGKAEKGQFTAFFGIKTTVDQVQMEMAGLDYLTDSINSKTQFVICGTLTLLVKVFQIWPFYIM